MRYLTHVVPIGMLGLIILGAPACNTVAPRASFVTPDEAAAALHQAFKTEDLEKLRAIFGRAGMEAVASGDAVSDRQDRAVVALAMDQSWRWEPSAADGQELIIGDEQWPFPVPLVKTSNGWRFDSEAGKEEVLARRIGANELGVIRLCRDYVRAQEEYASEPHDGKLAGLFAQRFRSTPGLHDGLFWRLKRGERRSPFGELVAAAIQEGYDPAKPRSSPFRGYRYRILTAQGPSAPGGRRNYVVNSEMTGGFALLAYPAKYAFSGVMTFVVGADGVVYQKDLGKNTERMAARLTEYDPDASWTAVESL